MTPPLGPASFDEQRSKHSTLVSTAGTLGTLNVTTVSIFFMSGNYFIELFSISLGKINIKRVDGAESVSMQLNDHMALFDTGFKLCY